MKTFNHVGWSSFKSLILIGVLFSFLASTYSCKLFQCGVENNIDGLEYTKAWLKRNHQKLLESSSFEGNSSSASATESQWSRIMSPNSVLASAFMELLDWDTSQILPEVQ